MPAGLHAVAIAALALLLRLPPGEAITATVCDSNPYTANSTFQANLDLVAASLPANASTSPAGFAVTTVGAVPDQVNGMALCRADTNASECAGCLRAAFQSAGQSCSMDKGVTVFRDACHLRFAGRQFLDFLDQDQWAISELVVQVGTAVESVDASDARFTAAVGAIYTALVDSAVAATNSTRKFFATSEMAFSPKIYGLAQCAPDLTPDQCRGCLGILQGETMARHMSGRPQSNDAAVVWCMLRYSVSPVYEGQAMLQLAAPPEPAHTLSPTTRETGTGTKPTAGISAGIAGSVVLMLILSVFLFLRFRFRRRRVKGTENDHHE